VVARGVVQGVGFRVSLARAARTRGATGWVRNRPDGAVEAVIEGAPDAVESLVQWCRDGPRGSQVDGLEVRDEAPEGLTSFEIR
jgi:acylphosphatase